MKKSLIILLIIVCITATTGMANVDSLIANFVDYKLKINGAEITTDLPMVDINGRTYVELRSLCDIMGSEISWNERTQTIKIQSDSIYTETENIYFSYCNERKEKGDIVLTEETVKNIADAWFVQKYGESAESITLNDSDDEKYYIVSGFLNDRIEVTAKLRKTDAKLKELELIGDGVHIHTAEGYIDAEEQTACKIGQAVLEQLYDKEYFVKNPITAVNIDYDARYYNFFMWDTTPGSYTIVTIRKDDGKIIEIGFDE